MMRNLAGVKDCDDFIFLELKKAGLEPIPTTKNNGEVAFGFCGEVGGFKLTRAWTYWVASSEENDGLPLDMASELHEAEYKGEDGYETYGDCVRVVGHCGCPHPKEWINKSGKIDSYHIDTQEGLNKFVQIASGEKDGVLAMYEACKNFVKKVETGKARSTRSYNEMKKAVELYEKQK